MESFILNQKIAVSSKFPIDLLILNNLVINNYRRQAQQKRRYQVNGSVLSKRQSTTHRRDTVIPPCCMSQQLQINWVIWRRISCWQILSKGLPKTLAIIRLRMLGLVIQPSWSFSVARMLNRMSCSMISTSWVFRKFWRHIIYARFFPRSLIRSFHNANLSFSGCLV